MGSYRASMKTCICAYEMGQREILLSDKNIQAIRIYYSYVPLFQSNIKAEYIRQKLVGI